MHAFYPEIIRGTTFFIRRETWSPIGVCCPPTAIRYLPITVGSPQPLSVTLQPLSVTLQPLSVTLQLLSVALQPPSVTLQPPFVGHPPTAVGYSPSAVGYPPTAVGYPQPPSVTNRRRFPFNCCRFLSNRRRFPFNRRWLPSNRRRVPSNLCWLLCNRCLSMRPEKEPATGRPEIFSAVKKRSD